MTKEALNRFALSLFMLCGVIGSVAWFVFSRSPESIGLVLFFAGMSLGSALA